MNWKENLDHYESLIRSGHGEEVKKALREISWSRAPREHYGALANLAVRVGLPTLALKILGREVKKATSFERCSLNNFERAEYASALTAVGAYSEAHRILGQLDSHQVPQSLLYDAFSLFNQWKYEEAIGTLESYLQLVSDPYRRRVGRVNLCAAWVYCGNYDKALGELENLKSELEREGALFLLGNTLELMAQCYLSLGDFPNCDRVLELSERNLEQTGSSYSNLFTLKWRAVSALAQGERARAEALLQETRQIARQLFHFETLRECDLFEGKYHHQQGLLEKVYFGTPFASYREKILRLSNKPIETQAVYHWTLEPNDGAGSPHQNFSFAVAVPLSGVLENSNLHNLQRILSSDFYAPWRIGTLFSVLFPDEHYDVQNSPNRVYQLLHRWNEHAEQNQVPLRMISQGQGFFLQAQATCQVEVPGRLSPISRSENVLSLLREHFRGRPFQSKEAQEFLNKSQSRTSEILQEAQKLGLIREGQGRSTRYKFAA